MGSYPGYVNPTDAFLQAFMQGLELRRRNQERQQSADESKLRIEVGTHNLKQAKIEEKLAARKHMEDMQAVLEGLPGIQSQKSIPFGGDLQGSFDVTGMPEARVPNLDIPAVPEAGLPGYQMPVRSYEEKLAQIQDELRQKLNIEGEAKKVDIPPELAARMPVGGATRLDPEALAAASPLSSTNLPAGIYPVGHPLHTGGLVERPAAPLVESAYTQQEGTKREGMQNRTSIEVAKINAKRWNVDIPEETVNSISDRVASGEMTFQQGLSALGGPSRGGGPKLVAALDAKDKRIVPPKVREQIGAVAQARNMVNLIDEQVQNVIAADTPEERVQATMLLEGTTQSVASILSKKAFLESGRLTEQDINRAKSIVPGWKAANFAPGYAKKEIAVLREIVDRTEQGIYQSSFGTVGRGNNPEAPNPATRPQSRNAAPVGAQVRGPDGQVHTMTISGWKPPIPGQQ